MHVLLNRRSDSHRNQSHQNYDGAINSRSSYGHLDTLWDITVSAML